MTMRKTAARRTTTEPRPGEVAIVTALHRLPPEYLPDVLRFVEFLDYKASMTHEDDMEEQALWAAVEVNQEYKKQHPDEDLEIFETGSDFLEAATTL